MSRGDTREGEEGPSAMAVAGGLKLDGRLLIMASAVFTVSLLLLVFGISHGRREQSGDKLVDFEYLGLLFRSVNPYFFAALGIAAAIGFSVLGAAWCVFLATRRFLYPNASRVKSRALDVDNRAEIPLVFSRTHQHARWFFTLETTSRAERRFRASTSRSKESDIGSSPPTLAHA